MTKYLVFIFILLLSKNVFAQTPKFVLNSLGLITKGNEPVGTAFCVSPHKIITAAHVLYDASNKKIIDTSSIRFTILNPIKLLRVNIIKLDTCLDFAELEIEEGVFSSYLNIATFSSIYKADKIKYYGFDFNASELFHKPQMTAYSSEIEKVSIIDLEVCKVGQIQFKGRAFYGYSGGPILNSKNEAIGFVSKAKLAEANSIIFGHTFPEFK